MQRTILGCAFALVGTVALTIAGVHVMQSQSPSQTQKATLETLHSMSPTLMKLRLDVKEYMIVQDKKYLIDFDQEAKRLYALLDTLDAQSSQDKNRAQTIDALRRDMQAFDRLFKAIIALEEENAKIEVEIFAKYDALLEEHPNRILFQAFTDNDPMSGNSAAHLLDAALKYKLAVASYSLNNSEFFLIRTKEMKDLVKKHADKIELLVDNKESVKRIKAFKEVFETYTQGFDRLASNIQAKRKNVSDAFDDVVPRMMSRSQALLFASEK
ncbi:hypothetical protein [Sulfurospirillum cavolei]|uniref:hypothetical protein n=1 Tax=Sulfurospirillum cavolei TaxID=366522 RepID=UPI000764C2F3|nr:hypothetical protein [Sulfurospirillum cavolei]